MSDDLSIPSPTYRIRHSHGIDPGTKRLALIALGLGGALIILLGGWTMLGHRSGTIPVIQADSRPIRVKPDNPGGMQVAGANDEILSGGSDTGAGKLGPQPEAPAPQALRAPPPPAVVAPAPGAPPVAALKPIAPTAKPSTAAMTNRTVVETPAAAPAKPAAVAANDRAVVEKPSSPAAAAGAQHAAPAGQGAQVQLAAMTTEAGAKAEWQRLQKRMPDVFAHHQPSVSRFERDGHGMWRLRTGGFSDVAQATVFCEHVRAKGAGCSVADF